MKIFIKKARARALTARRAVLAFLLKKPDKAAVKVIFAEFDQA